MRSDEYDQLLADTKALIAIQSANPPGDEGPVAEWLLRRLAPFSTAEVQPVAEGRSNFIAVFDFGPGPTLLFCTHLDVVPVQAEAQWVPEICDGRLYARGACDAKGTLAAMIAACLRLRARAGGLTGRLILAAVADEESGALGARALIASGLTADAAVIGEPTTNSVVLASRGAVRLSVRFSGVSAHASVPSNGRNAVYAAARFILAVERYEEQLAAVNRMASCAATVVTGGSRLNVIPDSCTVLVDRRVGPSETCTASAAEVTALASESIAELDGITMAVESAGVWLEPFEIPADTPFARDLLASLGQTEPGPVFSGGTDAPHLISAGIPTAIVGPGSLDTAHSAHEYVELDELVASVSVYETVARAFLNPIMTVSRLSGSLGIPPVGTLTLDT